jgi:DNA-binding transcriptional MerR regulator
LENFLPLIPAKRYFTIGEVSDLCGVKPHVLRYWEQEFTQLRPMKRRGNRRYYQHHEVLMIRKIRDLLYDQGFTISGARNKLHEIVLIEEDKRRNGEVMLDGIEAVDVTDLAPTDFTDFVDFEESELSPDGADLPSASIAQQRLQLVRRELYEIRDLLSVAY